MNTKFETNAIVGQDGSPLKDIAEIELWKEDSDAGWFCDLITILDLDTGFSTLFPVQRWVRPGIRYRIRAFDTCLPQDDPYPEQRIRELEYKRRVYLTYPTMYYVVEDQSYSSDMIKVCKSFFPQREHHKLNSKMEEHLRLSLRNFAFVCCH